MNGRVLTGQLTYVDTEDSQIQIMDEDKHQVTDLDIDANTELPGSFCWEDLVGENVEVVAIDGKVATISLTQV